MSTSFQKFIARQELIRRQTQETTDEALRITQLPTDELEKILEEKDENEK